MRIDNRYDEQIRLYSIGMHVPCFVGAEFYFAKTIRGIAMRDVLVLSTSTQIAA